MRYSIKELIEQACALSIETAETAFLLASSGGNNPKTESRMKVCKADYEASIEVLRKADPNGYQHNIDKVAEITRLAMQQQNSTDS
jgi:hypothetical protein